MTNITHTTTSATGIGTALGLPAGVSAAWSSNVITISGTPTAAGIFTYTIPLTGTSCSGVNATGTITVNAPSFTCGTSTVTDVDNNIYNTVAIGTGTTAQCWTASNLKVTKYNDGSPITPDATGTSTGSGIGEMWSTRNSGAYTIYEHNNANVTTYGLLYNWFAATDAKKLCPDGWHVPSDAEWTIMIQTLDPKQLVTSVNVSTFTGVQSSTAGTVMKSTTVEWNPGSPRTNTSGFSALPGGYREFYGSFDAIRNFAWFWSATEYDGSYAWYRALSNVNGFVDRGNYWKTLGASVRCLRD
jgi:uncharacterized protein (TIGR02145 family)